MKKLYSHTVRVGDDMDGHGKITGDDDVEVADVFEENVTAVLVRATRVGEPSKAHHGPDEEVEVDGSFKEGDDNDEPDLAEENCWNPVPKIISHATSREAHVCFVEGVEVAEAVIGSSEGVDEGDDEGIANDESDGDDLEGDVCARITINTDVIRHDFFAEPSIVGDVNTGKHFEGRA